MSTTSASVGQPIVCPDGSTTYHSDQFDQTYHSIRGALTESQHIFLDASGVQARLQAGEPTQVLEVGFGLGLNALLTADRALVHGANLYFHSLENALLPSSLLAALNYRQLLDHPTLSDHLLHALEGLGNERNLTVQLAETVKLQLSIGDATTLALPGNHFHACYLDAFSPDVNPECWTPAFLNSLFRALQNNGVLATYSARRSVRRALAAAGFLVQKRPGPPGKRDIVIAVKAVT